MSTSSSTQASLILMVLNSRHGSGINYRLKEQNHSFPTPWKAVEKVYVVNLWGRSFFSKLSSPLTATCTMKIFKSMCPGRAANFNKLILVIRPPNGLKPIRPPGFPHVQNPHANRDLKGITTEVVITIQGPESVNQDVEVQRTRCLLLITEAPSSVQLLLFKISKTRIQILSPMLLLLLLPFPKASIPFPSRRNDERRKEKANDKSRNFMKSLEI
ncbi:hypothetical protein Tco_0340848 [Tanacetum coccineum]